MEYVQTGYLDEKSLAAFAQELPVRQPYSEEGLDAPLYVVDPQSPTSVVEHIYGEAMRHKIYIKGKLEAISRSTMSPEQESLESCLYDFEPNHLELDVIVQKLFGCDVKKYWGQGLIELEDSRFLLAECNV